jgi:hypothetical protein
VVCSSEVPSNIKQEVFGLSQCCLFNTNKQARAGSYKKSFTDKRNKGEEQSKTQQKRTDCPPTAFVKKDPNGLVDWNLSWQPSSSSSFLHFKGTTVPLTTTACTHHNLNKNRYNFNSSIATCYERRAFHRCSLHATYPMLSPS